MSCDVMSCDWLCVAIGTRGTTQQALHFWATVTAQLCHYWSPQTWVLQTEGTATRVTIATWGNHSNWGGLYANGRVTIATDGCLLVSCYDVVCLYVYMYMYVYFICVCLYFVCLFMCLFTGLSSNNRRVYLNWRTLTLARYQIWGGCGLNVYGCGLNVYGCGLNVYGCGLNGSESS